jgi:hypothetical protein
MMIDIHTARSTINYLTNSENKRQTTDTIKQILTQKLFFLQNIKDSTLNLTFVMVFSITENGHVACLAEFGQNFSNLN